MIACVGKRYKGRECAYCGRPSSCPDHVIAREFFLPEHRADLPQVPVCDACNGEKSALEHYLTALLPFGARHTSAQESLEQVPKRLRKNQRLHRELGRGQGHVWAKDDSGLVLQMMTLPVNGPKLLDLFKWITRGLVWFHWQVRLTDGHEVTPLTLTAVGEEVFDRQFALNARARVQRDLGNGTFTYEGAQGVDVLEVTIWQFAMFGGVWFGDPNVPGEVATRIGVMTGPRTIRENAARAVRFGVRQL